MHLRRGDFTRNHADIAPPVDDVVSFVRKIAKEAGVRDLVLATNGLREEVAKMQTDLQGEVAIHRYTMWCVGVGGDA
jgi:hypothetical protein